MRVLLVTEKCSQSEHERDGGARIVETLQRAFGPSLSIMQFGPRADPAATWYFEYPSSDPNRFLRRLANADFIAQRVHAHSHGFTHIIFIHLSMQFGLAQAGFQQGITIWTFPMFLTPSYISSGEIVPVEYMDAERKALKLSKNILTPSYLEKKQLLEIYGIPHEHVCVIPRGIDMKFVSPSTRLLQGPAVFCSIQSIKPQKNTLGLVRLFAKLRHRLAGAKLQIIGPIQNPAYGRQVRAEITRLGLDNSVELTGYVPSSKLALAIQSCHMHLSTSLCETFGRSIFESLACGLPNVARRCDNAAADFLKDLPYIRFIDHEADMIEAIEQMLENLPKLSSMALEIGRLYDDESLAQLLVAKLCASEPLAICDFDGTLYHKGDPQKTKRCIESFSRYPVKVLCSARTTSDLLNQLQAYSLEVDWIISFSGAMISDGKGRPLWLNPLQAPDVAYLENKLLGLKRYEFEGEVLQLESSSQCWEGELGFRTQVYQGQTFISDWQTSKLRATHKLLQHIKWAGQVHAFGDGPYDEELLNYYDGILITPSPKNPSQQKELSYA